MIEGAAQPDAGSGERCLFRSARDAIGDGSPIHVVARGKQSGNFQSAHDSLAFIQVDEQFATAFVDVCHPLVGNLCDAGWTSADTNAFD